MMKRRLPRHAFRARRGVTIIELLVALTLLTVGLLSIVGISGSISRSLGESRGESLASMLARASASRTATVRA